MSPNILLGIPVETLPEMPPYTPYEGSIQTKCELCGRLVWQGPKQQEVKASKPETQVVCAVCAVIAMQLTGMSPTIKKLRED
jgi:ribosomal protein S27E